MEREWATVSRVSGSKRGAVEIAQSPAIPPISWTVGRFPLATPFRKLTAAKDSPNSVGYRPRWRGRGNGAGNGQSLAALTVQKGAPGKSTSCPRLPHGRGKSADATWRPHSGS